MFNPLNLTVSTGVGSNISVVLGALSMRRSFLFGSQHGVDRT